jgi:hypothetical protein
LVLEPQPFDPKSGVVSLVASRDRLLRRGYCHVP